MLDDRVAIQVEGGLVVAYPPEGDEFMGVRKAAKVIFMPSQSMSSQSLLRRTYQIFLSILVPNQIISNDFIFGFINTKNGIIGFGGPPHFGMYYLEDGFLVKFYKENDSWKSKHILNIRSGISDLKESNFGLRLFTESHTESRWIHYFWSELK